MENTSEDSRRVLVAVDGSKPSELAMQCEFVLLTLNAHRPNLSCTTYIHIGGFSILTFAFC